MNSLEYNNHPSESWAMSIGTAPGYGADASNHMKEGDFAKLYLSCAEEIYEETGVYISALIHEVRALYSPKWGCPTDGEPCYELRGTRNPQFAEKEAYESALIKLVSMLKDKLQQSTVYLEIQPTQMWYFK